VLDRLVGYQVSPLLCRAVGGRLSAGRVQSVALRMVVEREREIEQFIKTEYWTIAANLAATLPPIFDARLFKVGDQTVKTGGFDEDIKKNEILIGNETLAGEIAAEAEQQSFVVSEVTTKERKRNPVPPLSLPSSSRRHPQTRLRGKKDDDAGAEALRRCRARA